MKETEYVRACLDNSPFAPVVSDMAAWVAERLGKPLELVHAIQRHHEAADPSDHSGAIGVDASAMLLDELTEQDTKRSHADREVGRALLEQYRKHVESNSDVPVDVRMRWGSLDETVAHLQSSTAIYLLGRKGETVSEVEGALGRNLEKTIRTLNVPVMMVTRNAHIPTRVVYAFDGSAANRAGVRWIARTSLLKGLPIHIVAAAKKGSTVAGQLSDAIAILEKAGYDVTFAIEQGHPESVITNAITSAHADLLVMGAYAHSRMSKLFRRSTTNAVLRKTTASAMIVRF